MANMTTTEPTSTTSTSPVYLLLGWHGGYLCRCADVITREEKESIEALSLPIGFGFREYESIEAMRAAPDFEMIKACPVFKSDLCKPADAAREVILLLKQDEQRAHLKAAKESALEALASDMLNDEDRRAVRRYSDYLLGADITAAFPEIKPELKERADALSRAIGRAFLQNVHSVQEALASSSKTALRFSNG